MDLIATPCFLLKRMCFLAESDSDPVILRCHLPDQHMDADPAQTTVFLNSVSFHALFIKLSPVMCGGIFSAFLPGPATEAG